MALRPKKLGMEWWIMVIVVTRSDRTGLDRHDPGPGVMTMQWTLKPDIPQLLTQRLQKINGLCIMLEQWKAFSHPLKILPLSHLSQFCSSPRPHNQPCVVTPRLELQSPCVRTLDSIQSQPPVWSYPLSSHVIPVVLLNLNFDNCSLIVNERWSANWWFSLNDVEREKKIRCLWVVLSWPRAYGDVKFLIVVGVWWFIVKNCAFIVAANLIWSFLVPVFIASRMLQMIAIRRLLDEYNQRCLWV